MGITLEQLRIKIKKDLDIYYGRRIEKPYTFNETYLVKQLSTALGGGTEIKTKVGRADLVTDHFILEAKISKYCKQALGQLLSYKIYIERPFLILGLIGDIPSYMPEVCEHYNILLLHYSLNTYRWEIL